MVSLKSAHLYRRVPTDLSKATHTGGAISLCAIGVIVTLLVSHLQSFNAVRVERTMEIDQVYDESMVVSFNITLPRLPCALASLDLTDALGTSIHNVTRGLSKMRIDEHTNQKLLSQTDPNRWMRPSPTPEIRGQELAGHQKRPLVEIAPHLDVPAFLRKAGRAQLAVVLFGASWCAGHGCTGARGTGARGTAQARRRVCGAGCVVHGARCTVHGARCGTRCCAHAHVCV